MKMANAETTSKSTWTLDVRTADDHGREHTTRVYLFPLGDTEPPPARQSSDDAGHKAT